MSFIRPLLGTAAAALAAAVFVACSDNSDPEVPPLPTATERTAGNTSPTPQAGSPTPTASPTPDAAAEEEAAIDAASAALGGARHISPLTLPACLEDNPDRNPCIELQSEADQLVRGLARFNLGDPDGGGATFLMGRMADGQWGYWQGSQQQSYVLDTLPGDLIACGTDSDAAIHEEPSSGSPEVTTLEDLTELSADSFVLTEPGDYAVQGERGEGWYHLTAPEEGWINATHTTDAALGDCILHDAIEQVDRG